MRREIAGEETDRRDRRQLYGLSFIYNRKQGRIKPVVAVVARAILGSHARHGQLVGLSDGEAREMWQKRQSVSG